MEHAQALTELLGDKGWSDDPAEREAHGREMFGRNGGRVPLVLKPGSIAEVQATLRLCAERGLRVIPQGGNTGYAGGGVPDGPSELAILSLKRLNAIRSIDPTGDAVTAEAGVTLQEVQDAAAGVNRLFPVSIGSKGSCTVGGVVSTNAGGLNVLRYGMTRPQVLGLEVVLADGTALDLLSDLRKDNTGLDLKQLFVGSEGTLGVVTAACFKLWPRPRETQTVWLGVESLATALDLFNLFRERLGETITSFEVLSDRGVAASMAAQGGPRPIQAECPWHLLIEAAWTFEGGLAERLEAAVADGFERGLIRDGTQAASEAQRGALWGLREWQGENLTRLGPVLAHDVAVPIARIPEMVARCDAALARAVPGARPCPFGHLGDGNLHYNVVAPEGMDARAFGARKAEVQRLVFDQVEALGGTISAEHGIGRMKRDELAKRKPTAVLATMRAVKRALDPDNRLNPGAVIDV